MGKKRKKARSRTGLQAVTLCISTTLVLILLGMMVFSVLTAHNLSAYVRENLTVTVMLGMGRLGPTLAVATILIAQLSAAAAIDAFGIMGTEKLAFGWSKWAWLALMTGGVLLFKMK